VGEGGLDGLPGVLVGGQECHAHGVRPLGRQLGVDDLAQERVRHLDQDPGTVSGGRVGPGGAAMVEVPQHLETLLHDVMTGDTVETRDETDAARVVFVRGVVQALCGRPGERLVDHGSPFEAGRTNRLGHDATARLRGRGIVAGQPT
jgi:hypothetical protein